jgi:hypothetical protein
LYDHNFSVQVRRKWKRVNAGEIVMEIMGHEDCASFRKYIQLTDKVKREEMNRAWDVPMLKVV